MKMLRILVLCTGNACRSQMAEGFLKHYLGSEAEVYSAGIEAHGLNLKATQVMREVGVGIDHQQSKTIEELGDREFDYILTVCDHASEHCPFIPSKAQRLHHNFPDPAKVTGSEEEMLQAFRDCREQIHAYIKEWAQTLLSSQ